MLRITIVAAVALLAACQSPPAPLPQPENSLPPAADAAPAQDQRQPPISGGYGAANEETEEFKAARALAIKALYDRHPTRARIESTTSEVQVVAGLNYRFRFALSGGAVWEVVVFRPLRGALEVTSVTEMKG